MHEKMKIQLKFDSLPKQNNKTLSFEPISFVEKYIPSFGIVFLIEKRILFYILGSECERVEFMMCL